MVFVCLFVCLYISDSNSNNNKLITCACTVQFPRKSAQPPPRRLNLEKLARRRSTDVSKPLNLRQTGPDSASDARDETNRTRASCAMFRCPTGAA